MSDRRSRQLIDRFQNRLFTRVLIYGLVYQATLWNVLFCWRLIANGDANFFAEYRQFFFDSYPMLLCFLVLVPVFAWDAVKFCHRVAGPIYHVRTTLLDVAAARPVHRVQLRRHDQLSDLRDDMNTMLEALARRGAITLVDAEPLPKTSDWPQLRLGESLDSPSAREAVEFLVKQNAHESGAL
jgi:hypothetical protein